MVAAGFGEAYVPSRFMVSGDVTAKRKGSVKDFV